MELFLIIYLTVLVFMIVPCSIGLIVGKGSNEKEDRVIARIILLSPVWPLALVGFIVYSIKPLWTMSGWGK